MKHSVFSGLVSAALACAVFLQSAGAVLPQVHAANTVTLSPYRVHTVNDGVFEGWGTSLCWWANRIGYSDSLSQQAADAFYGENGLRLNIARFNIGGGDDPTHDHITRTDSNMPGYTRIENGKAVYDWNADAAQRNVLKRCAEAAGDDAIVEMFSNSPPYYMTNSGCSSGANDPGKNNLRDDSYPAFAAYLAEVCAHYQNAWGIQIQSVEPMNEPHTFYWRAMSNKQEGCRFSMGDSQSRIVLELKKALAERGMQNTVICASDETSIDLQLDEWNAFSPKAKAALSRIDTHGYSGVKRTELKNAAVSAGKNLWMSEFDGKGTSGSNAGAMGAGLRLAEHITADRSDMQASAWILRQVIDSHVCAAGYNGKKNSGMPDINGNFRGTAVVDHDRNTIILSKKYYAFGQYTRHIRPGMLMPDTAGNTLAAYDPEQKQLVIIAYNTSGSTAELQYDLSEFTGSFSDAKIIRTSQTENWADAGTAAVTGGKLNASLAPNSITTYLIDGAGSNLNREDRIDLSGAVLSGSKAWRGDETVSYRNAFDGNLNTYFDGVGSGCAMADLGVVYDFSAFAFCPRRGYENRCVDARFEVSADGVSWQTVYTISEIPGFGMHVADVSAVGRYVRCSVPDGAPQNNVNHDDVYCCNIAELAFYGTPHLTEPGDVNADGSVDAADVRLLRDYLLAKETQIDAGTAEQYPEVPEYAQRRDLAKKALEMQ